MERTNTLSSNSYIKMNYYSIIHSYKHFKYVLDQKDSAYVLKLKHADNILMSRDNGLNNFDRVYVLNSIEGLKIIDFYKSTRFRYFNPITVTYTVTTNTTFKERIIAGGKVIQLTIIILPP